MASIKKHLPLLLTGLLMIAMGVAAILSPMYMAGSLVWLAGWLTIGAASLATLQFIWGWLRGDHVHISLMFLLGISLQFAMGAALLWFGNVALSLLCLLLGIALILEAVAQVFFSRHLEHRLSRIGFLFQAAITGGLGIAALWYIGSEQAETMVIIVLGIKLLVFGIALVQISLHRATQVEEEFVFGAQSVEDVNPVPGEIYAVFLGGGYHVGVCVDNGEVVDLLREINSARLTTWEDFLLGRDPEHWQYPDLPPVAAEEVIRTARESIGRDMPYNFLEFNCEHFSIYCKSGGTTTFSKYAQLSLCHQAVSKRPLLGSFLELQARVVGALTHSLGGEFGKKVSLSIRHGSAFVTNRLLATYLGQDLQTAARASHEAFKEQQLEASAESPAV